LLKLPWLSWLQDQEGDAPDGDVAYYSHNRTGDQRGVYRSGEFDAHGRPDPAAHRSGPGRQGRTA
jgi:hypothetical protein